MHIADSKRFHAEIFTDTVIYVNDVIADINIAKMGYFAFRAFCRLARFQFFLLPAEDILFGNNDEMRLRKFKTVEHRADNKCYHFVRQLRRIFAARYRNVILLQNILQVIYFLSIAQTD